MSKFVLDANLSPETRRYLTDQFSFDVTDLMTQNLFALTDGEVVALAKEQGRVIITFDRDFGEIYHFRERGTLGVIVLRLENQTVESVNSVLARFFSGQASSIDLDRTLVVLDERRVRFIRGQDEDFRSSSSAYATASSSADAWPSVKLIASNRGVVALVTSDRTQQVQPSARPRRSPVCRQRATLSRV